MGFTGIEHKTKERFRNVKMVHQKNQSISQLQLGVQKRMSTMSTNSLLAAEALDKLRITNVFRKLTPADVERTRGLLFRRSNASTLPAMRRKTTARFLFLESLATTELRCCAGRNSKSMSTVCAMCVSPRACENPSKFKEKVKLRSSWTA